MAARKVPSDTKYFKYYNANPKRIHTSDCVIRSLALATDSDWETVYKALCRLGNKMCMLPNERRVWVKYLKDNGWVQKRQPKKQDGTKYSGAEFAAVVKSSRVIIMSIGVRHLSVVKNKQVWDIWDCTDRHVGIYFERSGL